MLRRRPTILLDSWCPLVPLWDIMQMRYTPQNTTRNAQVLLDGEPVKGDFIMVDDEEHIAEVVLMVNTEGQIMTEILHGNYTVQDV
jgi:hypothetical protein